MSQISISRVNENIVVDCPYRYLNQIKAITGARWNWPVANRWSYPASATVLNRLLTLFAGQQLQISSSCEAYLVDDDIASAEPAIVMPSGLWKHQQDAFTFAMGRDAAMLAMAMGTGKTRVVCELIKARGCKRTLVLCPKAVIDDGIWRREIELVFGSQRVEIVDGSGSIKERAQVIEGVLVNGPVIPQLVLVNYEAARMSPLSDVLLNVMWDLVIVDESHKIADCRTAISQFCQNVMATYRLALTGTPFKQTPLDIYGQSRFLSPGSYGGLSHYGFMVRYGHYRTYGSFKKLLGLKSAMAEEFMGHFHQFAVLVANDVLDLPDVTHINRYCVLGPKAKSAYDALERYFWAAIDDGKITTANGGVKILRLQQLTGGDITLDEGTHVTFDDAKYEQLKELLDEIGDEPVVVFARFTRDLKSIELATTALGNEYAELSGNRHELKRWQVGDAQVIGVQIQSGGAGVDLTRARYCVYFSVGHSLTDYEQSLARVHRPGQTRPVTYVHLLAQGTIDEMIQNALAEKRDVVQRLLSSRAQQHQIA